MSKFAVATVFALVALGFAGTSRSSIEPIPAATGCQRVPSTGSLAPGLAASTTLEYSNFWQWSNASAGLAFDWSIRKRDGTVIASGSSAGSGSSRSVAANDYTFRIVNRGSVGQFWNVCYDVV